MGKEGRFNTGNFLFIIGVHGSIAFIQLQHLTGFSQLFSQLFKLFSGNVGYLAIPLTAIPYLVIGNHPVHPST